MLNQIGYNPVDDDSPTGFCRPPRDPQCCADYFSALGYVEDDGAFLIQEWQTLLVDPDSFFVTPEQGTNDHRVVEGLPR